MHKKRQYLLKSLMESEWFKSLKTKKLSVDEVSGCLVLVTELLNSSKNWTDFRQKLQKFYMQNEVLQKEEKHFEESELSDFDQKLRNALFYDPREK